MNEEEQKNRAAAFGKYALSAFIFAGLVVICIYKNSAAITYPVYMVGLLVLLHKVLPLKLNDNATKCYVLALLLLSVSKCTTASRTLQRLDGIAVFLLFFSLVIHTVCEDGGWEFPKRLRALCKAVVEPWLHAFTLFVDQAAFIREKRNKSEKSLLGFVGIGLLIALPLVFIVLLLLGSADKVFGDMVEFVIDKLFFLEYLPDYFGLIVWFTGALLGWYAGSKFFAEESFTVADSQRKQYHAVVGITINTVLAVIYVLFSGVQFAVLFTGGMALPEKYTYAEYAHQGFYQLVIVCLLNLMVVTLSKALFAENKALKILLAIICCCTYVMIASGVLRMLLYVRAYQFTFLRLFVLWAMAILAICLTAVLLNIFLPKVNVYRVSLVAVTIGYLLFAYVHPDYWIARYNMSKETTWMTPRFDMGKDPVGPSAYDERYLIDNLSADAVPAYLKDAALLERYKQAYYLEHDSSESVFYKARHFNISEAVAEYLMEKQ